MNWNAMIVVAVAVFVAGLGACGLASPAAMRKFATSWWQSRGGLWAAAVLRLAFGIALWQAAAESRFPAVFRVLAVVSVIFAFSLPLMGIHRFKAFTAWWSRQSATFLRIWSAIAVMAGVFFIWSVSG